MRLAAVSCLVALLAGATGASAGSLRVGPTLVELHPRQPVASLRVTNYNATRTSIEVEVVEWTQASNEDRYEATSDLLVTPPVFELAPGASQVVRVGMPKATAGNVPERAFRVFISEMPADTSTGPVRIQTLMRVGVPVFVRHDASPPKPSLDWKLVPATENLWRLEVSNRGPGHDRILGIALDPASTPLSGAYVLPGATRTWLLPALEPGTKQLDLQITRPSGTREFVLAVPR